MKKLNSYLLWFVSTLLIVASVCEMSYGYMDPESFWAKLTVQNIDWEYYDYDWLIALSEIFISAISLFIASKLNPRQTRKFTEFVFRLGLGVMFVAASIHKITESYDFANLVAQYQFLPEFLVNIFSLTLAPLEFIVGLLLIIGPFNKWNTRLILIMMIMFIVAIGQALIRDLGITCGCFAIEGANDKKGAYVTLVRDIILIGPITWLYYKGKAKAWIWQIFK